MTCTSFTTKGIDNNDKCFSIYSISYYNVSSAYVEARTTISFSPPGRAYAVIDSRQKYWLQSLLTFKVS